MKSVVTKKSAWYVAGLHFECQGCGGCCSGPGEGYIWVTRREIEIIAEFLTLGSGNPVTVEDVDQAGLRMQYLERAFNASHAASARAAPSTAMSRYS